MGLLDDAIREHLELKRRHGADPDEVAQQEREALGAPRHGEFAQPAAEAPAGDLASAPEEDVAPAPVTPEADVTDVPDADVAPAPEPPAAEDPAEPAPGYDEDPWLPDEPDEVPSTEALTHPAGEEPAEDVLEETPEFLQETPEHDRLWFEQKPPRGFDWDK